MNSTKVVGGFSNHPPHLEDVNVRNDLWETPLYRAASSGDVTAVGKLISAGAQVDARAKKRFTPLHIASRFGYLEVMQALIDAGAGLNRRTIRSMTPLIVSCKYGQTEAAKLLLRHGCTVNVGDMFERTALHWAVKVDRPDIVDALLQHGADVTISDKFNKTPLMQAAKSNRPQMLKRFLDLRAPVDIADKLHREPVHVAALRGHRKCIEVLVQNDSQTVNRSTTGASTTPLMLAGSNAREDTVKLLLHLGADVNSVDNFGRTALIGLIQSRLQRHTEDNDSEIDRFCRVALTLLQANSNLAAVSDWPCHYFNEMNAPPRNAMETAVRGQLYDFGQMFARAGSPAGSLPKLFAMKTKDLPEYAIRDSGYIDWFRRFYRSPRPLRELSRNAFRANATSVNFIEKFASLPDIAPAIRSYIMYSDLQDAWECGSGAQFIGEETDEGDREEQSDTEEEMEPSVFDSDLYGDSEPWNPENDHDD